MAREGLSSNGLVGMFGFSGSAWRHAGTGRSGPPRSVSRFMKETHPASNRRLGSDCLQLEHVEVPGRVVNVQTVVDEVATIAKIAFGSQGIDKLHWRVPQFREWQLEAALTLVRGVVDDNDMMVACVIRPGKGNEVIRCPVAGPGRFRVNLRPRAVAKSAGLLQHPQQRTIKGGTFLLDRLDRATAEMDRHPNPTESQNMRVARISCLVRRGAGLVAVKIPTFWGGWCGSSRCERHASTLPRLCGGFGISSGSCRPGQTVRGLLCRAAVGRGPQERRTTGGGDRSGADGGATPVAAARCGAGPLV